LAGQRPSREYKHGRVHGREQFFRLWKYAAYQHTNIVCNRTTSVRECDIDEKDHSDMGQVAGFHICHIVWRKLRAIEGRRREVKSCRGYRGDTYPRAVGNFQLLSACVSGALRSVSANARGLGYGLVRIRERSHGRRLAVQRLNFEAHRLKLTMKCVSLASERRRLTFRDNDLPLVGGNHCLICSGERLQRFGLTLSYLELSLRKFVGVGSGSARVSDLVLHQLRLLLHDAQLLLEQVITEYTVRGQHGSEEKLASSEEKLAGVFQSRKAVAFMFVLAQASMIIPLADGRRHGRGQEDEIAAIANERRTPTRLAASRPLHARTANHAVRAGDRRHAP